MKKKKVAKKTFKLTKKETKFVISLIDNELDDARRYLPCYEEEEKENTAHLLLLTSLKKVFKE